MGAKYFHYKHNNPESKSIFDAIDYTKKNYLVAVTALVESPMKMFVFNQNRSSILFGNDSEEAVKNVVRFEANMRPYEFLKLLDVDNKPRLRQEWRITDFNNVLNENPYFQQQ